MHPRNSRPSAPIPSDVDWSLAACRGWPTAYFFPRESPSPSRVAEVRAMCRDCPIVRPCLATALQNNEHGLWAGTTLEDRARIRRRTCPDCRPDLDPLAAWEDRFYPCPLCLGLRHWRRAMTLRRSA